MARLGQTRLGHAGYAYGRRWIILRPEADTRWTVLDRRGQAVVHETQHATCTAAKEAIDAWTRNNRP